MTRSPGTARKTQVVAQRPQTVADPGDDFALEWIAGRLGGGERRQVIGLACEHTRISTPRMGPVDPEELWEHHASLRRIIVTAIERYGGRIVRNDLDVTVAYWGYPQTERTTHATRFRPPWRSHDRQRPRRACVAPSKPGSS